MPVTPAALAARALPGLAAPQDPGRRRWAVAMASLATLQVGCTSMPQAAPPQAAPGRVLDLLAAGQGSLFLPYAEGVAAWFDRQPAGALRVRAVVTRGSIDNLQQVQQQPERLGLAFLGTVHEAVHGSAGWTQGQRLDRLRALTPMYETSFQLAALRRSGLRRLGDLQGRRVGVGPAGGPAESFFKGLAAERGLEVQAVNGQPNELIDAVVEGRIDALWQGASPPIPALRAVLERADAMVFALAAEEIAAMRRRFPFLAEATLAAGTYRGQDAPLKSVAAWNFVVAHRDLPDAEAYAFTRTLLAAEDPARQVHASAGPTRAANARFNTVLPFHPGALRRYRELGIDGLKAA